MGALPSRHVYGHLLKQQEISTTPTWGLVGPSFFRALTPCPLFSVPLSFLFETKNKEAEAKHLLCPVSPGQGASASLLNLSWVFCSPVQGLFAIGVISLERPGSAGQGRRPCAVHSSDSGGIQQSL